MNILRNLLYAVGYILFNAMLGFITYAIFGVGIPETANETGWVAVLKGIVVIVASGAILFVWYLVGELVYRTFNEED